MGLLFVLGAYAGFVYLWDKDIEDENAWVSDLSITLATAFFFGWVWYVPLLYVSVSLGISFDRLSDMGDGILFGLVALVPPAAWVIWNRRNDPRRSAVFGGYSGSQDDESSDRYR